MERGLFLELYFLNFANQICGILKILKDVGEVFELKRPNINRVQAIKLYLENSSLPSDFLPHHYLTIHPKPPTPRPSSLLPYLARTFYPFRFARTYKL